MTLIVRDIRKITGYRSTSIQKKSTDIVSFECITDLFLVIANFSVGSKVEDDFVNFNLRVVLLDLCKLLIDLRSSSTNNADIESVRGKFFRNAEPDTI